MAAYTAEDLRKMLVKAESALRAVYALEGPMQSDGGRRLPVAKYAAMSRKQVDETYDFYHRHLMHRIAKILAQ